jgi:hypothetical protein
MRLGGTPGKQFLLGAEVNASVLHTGDAEIRTGYLAFTAYWYPNAPGGWFVKGGVGEGGYRRKTSTSDEGSDGGAFLVGAGYDIRVTRRISVTPMLTFWRSARANLTTDSSTLDTGLRHSGAAFQVGMTYHSPWGAANPPVEHPHIRRGFWVGFGYGGGNIAWQCDGCPKQDHGAGSGFIRLGGTPSKKILLGAEFNASGPYAGPFERFGRDTLAEEISAKLGAFTMYWYPDAAGGLFLKGGLGVSSYSREKGSFKARSDAGALLIGTGYDIRVNSMLSLTTMLTFWGSTKADLKDGGTTRDTGFWHDGVTLQIGVTFH